MTLPNQSPTPSPPHDPPQLRRNEALIPFRAFALAIHAVLPDIPLAVDEVQTFEDTLHFRLELGEHGNSVHRARVVFSCDLTGFGGVNGFKTPVAHMRVLEKRCSLMNHRMSFDDRKPHETRILAAINWTFIVPFFTPHSHLDLLEPISKMLTKAGTETNIDAVQTLMTRLVRASNQATFWADAAIAVLPHAGF